MGLLGDFLSKVDSAKRIAADRAYGLLTDPGAHLSRMGYEARDQIMPFIDAAERGDIPAVAEGLLSQGFAGPLATVYHGTPYQFAPTKNNPLGEFDPKKIGSGEGAQAYAYGHYVADAPIVGETYRRGLSSPEIVDKSGKVVYRSVNKANLSERGTTPEEQAAGFLAYAMEVQSSAPYQFAAGMTRQIENKATAEKVKNVLADWGEKGAVPKPGGSLYKVDLADEAIPKMLDWDKPLSEQTPEVKTALVNAGLEKIFAEHRAKGWLGGSHSMEKYSGSDIWDMLRMSADPSGKNWMSASPEASQKLKDAGIPGIRYLDAGSRGSGQGTSNYVVFPGNEGLLKILGRE